MTQIPGFSNMPLAFGSNAFANNAFSSHNLAANALGGFALQLAAGILGQFFNPLNAGPHAFAQLPGRCAVRCGVIPRGCHPQGPCIPKCPPMPQPAAQWTASMTGTHTANIDLGDGYRLQIDERSSEMTILNDATGEKTRIWGDPHVDVDGKRAFDFWGTTSFTLENGTKITINTEQWNGNPNAYVAGQVVITKGSNAIIVDGISQNQLGDLSLTMSNDGYAVDAAHRDGFTLHENASGSGWRTEGGAIATQDDLDATRVGREYGPGSALPSIAEFGQIMGGFLMLGMMFGFGNIFSGSNHGGEGRDRAGSNHHFHHHHSIAHLR
ncbi:MAG: DUF1521 domain-containing protein [Sphingomonadales bacterium]|nr:DUF1521 domain-containing protein [Sphingomonadales bacterium]